MANSARSLQRELDPLPFPARQRLLAALARDLVGTPELGALLNDLAGRDRFSRRIALQLASIASDRAGILGSIDLSDVDLAARAISVAVRLRVADDEIAALVPDLAPELRRGVYRACRAHGATELAERLLDPVRARWGDREAATLLATCRPDTVSRLLPELEYAVISWSALARRHPGVVLDFFEEQLTARPPAAWAELWERVGPGIAVLTSREPDRILALVEHSVSRVGVPSSIVKSMAALARHDRDRVLRLVLDPSRRGVSPSGRKFWRAFADAPDGDLIALARAAGAHHLPRFLHSLPPGRRSAVYVGLLGERDLLSSGLPLSILDELPHAARVREAARVLALPTVADDRHLRLEATARLDWDDARRVLLEATRRPTPDERAEAYPLYVAAAQASRDPEVVGLMLGSLSRLANEQDPVRASAVVALAGVPTWLFREVDAPRLRTLITDAVQARDSSYRTRGAVAELSRALVREGAISRRPALAAVGLDGLEVLSQHQPWVRLHRLDHDLPRGTEQVVFDVLKPRISMDARVGRYSTALAFAQGLGRRAWDLPDLQEYVDKARSAKSDSVVRDAISLWLAPPATRDARVQQVLRADRSTITIDAVRAAVSYRRTDLLDDIFRRPLHGRFLKRGVRYVPLFQGCFDAWLPRQSSTYADLLVGLATAPGVPVFERAAAVRTLGRVPGTVSDVRLFVDDAEIAVQEAALAALAHGDDPASVIPDLLAHADGDRARVATYALARCVRFVSAAQLEAYVRPILATQKVTSRKEAVRLLAEHRVPDAPSLLGVAWSTPGQHRDVRRAIASAVRYLLDDEASWDLLTEASTDTASATAIVEVSPSAVPASQRARFAALVGTVAGSDDADNARTGLLVMPRWAEWAGQRGLDIAASPITDLASTGTWRQAVSSLITSSDIVEDYRTLTAVVTALIGSLDVELAARDQPALQRLTALAGHLEGELGSSSGLRVLALKMADALAPVAPVAALDLATAAIPWDEEDSSTTAALLRVAALADRPFLAEVARRGATESLSRVLGRLNPAETHRIARALIETATPTTAMLGLGVVEVAGRAAGWQEPWMSLVTELRRYDDPDVRTAAAMTFMAPE